MKQGLQLNQIAYLTFSKSASLEAIERLYDNHANLDKKDAVYFGTLHSFCFRQMGLKRKDVATLDHYKEAATLCNLGAPSNGIISRGGKDMINLGVSPTDQIIFYENLARIKQLPVDDMRIKQMPINSVRNFSKVWKRYKDNRLIVDFTDMLSKWLELGNVPNIKLLIIDEAQDLSKLQWQVVKRLMNEAKDCDVIIAGDDDQCIHTWAGADLESFMSLKNFVDDTKILSQSYRIPSSVHDFADNIIRNVSGRYQKEFAARDSEGEVRRVRGIQEAFNYVTRDIDRDRALYRGGKDLEQLESCLVLCRHSHEVAAYRKFLRYRRRNVEVMTIHASKGKEADNVILMTGCSSKVAALQGRDREEEFRVWYVGATRAKKRLILCKSEGVNFKL